MGLYLQLRGNGRFVVEIVIILQYAAIVEADHFFGELVQVGAICLQVDEPSRLQDCLVGPEEFRVGQPFLRLRPGVRPATISQPRLPTRARRFVSDFRGNCTLEDKRKNRLVIMLKI